MYYNFKNNDIIQRFIYFLGNGLAIDCDPEKYPQKGHGGLLANDPIDDTKVNLKYETVLKADGITYEDFIYLYIPESSWESTENGDELYISYGRHYWLYEPFWNSLSVADKSEAEKLYDINPRKDLLRN